MLQIHAVSRIAAVALTIAVAAASTAQANLGTHHRITRVAAQHQNLRSPNVNEAAGGYLPDAGYPVLRHLGTHAGTAPTAAPAGDPSGLSIALSIAVTLTVLATIAAHVRWTRVRSRRAAHVA